LNNQIKKLDGHYIVCGYGRIGRLLTQYLVQKYIDVVVIERDSQHEGHLDEDGVLYLIGEAADENVLIQAGIKQASGIIAGVGTDDENVLLVQMARQLNSDIFVVARASQESSKKTLEEAGAHKVISPYDIGARRMAHAILRPTVIKFLETAFNDESTQFQFEEIRVSQGAKLTMFHELGIDTGINQEALIDLGKAFRTDIVDMFEANQKKLNRPFMQCRSFMLIAGKLPESVTQLYR